MHGMIPGLCRKPKKAETILSRLKTSGQGLLMAVVSLGEQPRTLAVAAALRSRSLAFVHTVLIAFSSKPHEYSQDHAHALGKTHEHRSVGDSAETSEKQSVHGHP